MKERDTHLSSRRAFLGQGALAGGVLATGALTLTALPAHAQSFSYEDAALLAFLLEVQALQSDFFDRVSRTKQIKAFILEESNTINTIAKQDAEQMRWCKLALRKFALDHNGLPSTLSGGFTRKRYIYSPMNSREAILSQALPIKKASAASWINAASEADSGEIASAFASLAGIQNRHAAMLATALGESSLMPMAPTLSVREARKELEDFGLGIAQ